MPRKHILTWQDGTANRPGRWRKKFRKKSYYFPGGTGKSDRAAYDRAVVAWEKLKAELDPTAPKPHQVAYDAVISQWEEVLECSRECGDSEMEEVATAKLADLRRRLVGKRPQPIRPEDTLNGYIDSYLPHSGTAALQEDILRLASEEPGKWEIQVSKFSPTAGVPGPWQAVVPGPEPIEVGGGFEEAVVMKDGSDRKSSEKGGAVPRSLEGMELHTLEPVGIFAREDMSRDAQREVWRDRLNARKRRAAVPIDITVKAFTAKFLAEKEANAVLGEITTSRAETLRIDLLHFADWFGQSRPVTDIGSQALVDYRTHLLNNADKAGRSSTWAHSRLSSLKTFVRWLWHMDALESLPRMLDSPDLRISKVTPPVITYSTEEIQLLLGQASDRTKLYILLMLNCGMTQKDISDLRPDEVDWDLGRITRKRSKTKKHRNVPEVSYVLWKETLALLHEERSVGDNSRVLLNENGQPLWQESRGSDGKFRKMDNVRNAFERLRKKTGITKTLKSFKKTSATRLRDNRDFASLERVFLSHAATSMSDKHYTQVPQNLLDEAIHWLHDELRIEEAVSSPRRPPITAGASPRKTHRRRCQPRQKHRRHNK
jgi:integrase